MEDVDKNLIIEVLHKEIEHIKQQYGILAEEHATLKSKYSLLILKVKDMVEIIGSK